ncbi:MAG: hypothetical protein HUU50_02590 [Candidatus Brocadiae bacterium]|nr:hypothetical protein [Candidatus Brocadiia bacterium]
MSIFTIFDALEAKIKANTAFEDFNFFRFESEANSNQQSLGSVPFVKVWWSQNSSLLSEYPYKIISDCDFSAEMRWNLEKSDTSAIEKIREYSLYDKAFKECLMPDEDCILGMESVLSCRVISRPGEIAGASALKHGRILVDVTIQYIENF